MYNRADNKNTNISKVEESDKGKTRATVLPLKLDERATKLIDSGYYQSISELIRDGVRYIVSKWEKYDLGLKVWEQIGGKVIEQVMLEVQSKTDKLEDMVIHMTAEHERLKKESNMISESEANQDNDTILDI